MSELYKVVNLDRDQVLAEHVHVAGTSRARKQGLLGVTALETTSGLWIAPCEAIHTFGMQLCIDVVFLDRQFRIRKLKVALAPRRIAVSLRSQSVLELDAGAIDRSTTRVGDRLRFTPANYH